MVEAQDFDLSDLKAFADEANAFQKQLMEESDRGAALVGAAYLDEMLIRLFRVKMRLTKKLDKELLEGFGPLSTMSSRTKIAYCLGWIGVETFRDLNLLRDIRNDFAHAHKPLTFSNATVQARCRELCIPKALLPGRLRKARDNFLLTATMLVLRLEFYRRNSQAPVAGWDPPIKPLIQDKLAKHL
jgi:DNA-binding MltR family transcriptional regulator